MSCCPPGSHGKRRASSSGCSSGGRLVVIEDGDGEPNRNLPCYVAANSAPLETSRRVVVVYTDVFGVDSGRHKQFADRLAAALNGNDNAAGDGETTQTTDAAAASAATPTTTVLIPDFFRGKPLASWWFDWLPDALNFVIILPQILWGLKFHTTEDVIEEDLNERLLPWIHKHKRDRQDGNSSGAGTSPVKFSVVGFCFGGWLVAKTLALDFASCGDASEGSVAEAVCGVGIHPALQVERMIYGRQEESLAEATKSKPILLLAAGNDDGAKPNSDVVKVLAEARKVPPGDVSVEFENMKHGWVTRGDGEKDPRIKDAQEKAFQLTTDFIEKHHPLED